MPKLKIKNMKKLGSQIENEKYLIDSTFEFIRNNQMI